MVMQYNDDDICIKMAKMEVKLENIESEVSDIKNGIALSNQKWDKIYSSLSEELTKKADKDFVWKVVGLIGAVITVLIALLTYLK